jgi:hypothetical protein
MHSAVMLSVNSAELECRKYALNAYCHYAECHFVEFRVFKQSHFERKTLGKLDYPKQINSRIQIKYPDDISEIG